MVGWVEFFLTHHGGLGKKNPLNQTQPNLYTSLIIFTEQLKVGQCDRIARQDSQPKKQKKMARLTKIMYPQPIK